jgi:lipopolysaccharide-induced tumor necrosis factor-alpha factor
MYKKKEITIKIFLLADVTQKTDHYSSQSRAATYAVPPPQHIESVVYTAPNVTMPNTYGIQINAAVTVGNKPVQCTCAHCHSLIITRIKRSPGLLVWIICFILILFGCWLGCCLIPFCIHDIQNTQHYCPNCKSFIGEYRPL